MKRIELKARRPSFGTLFRISFICAFGFVFFILLVALPIARIDPEMTPTKLAWGIIGLLTLWPLAVATGFSVGGWLLFALLGMKKRFRFVFICDDHEGLIPEKEPIQPPQTTTGSSAPGRV